MLLRTAVGLVDSTLDTGGCVVSSERCPIWQCPTGKSVAIRIPPERATDQLTRARQKVLCHVTLPSSIGRVGTRADGSVLHDSQVTSEPPLFQPAETIAPTKRMTHLDEVDLIACKLQASRLACHPSDRSTRVTSGRVTDLSKLPTLHPTRFGRVVEGRPAGCSQIPVCTDLVAVCLLTRKVCVHWRTKAEEVG